VRIACVNQDRGIRPERKKGAAVHLREMRRSFRALGADVLAVDASDPAEVRTHLETSWDEAPIDLIYERFSLGATAASEFASDRHVPLALEVNTPLVEEEERWRGPVGDEVRSQERRVMQNAQIVVTVSNEVARYTLERGVSPDRVFVFPNGVDTERFHPRAASDPLRARLVPPGRFALGFHGRLRGWHGFGRLAEACGRMLAEGHPIHLVVVGEGDFEQALEGHVPADRFTRVPWVDHDEVPAYVASFDALPLTYLPDAPCYFSPLKLAEAMACGVVPVVPDVGDLTKVVRHEENGLVFPIDDLDAFVSHVRRLILEAEFHQALSSAAVKTALEMSWTRIAGFVLERTLGSEG